ncbi:MAG: extracellular solute-binding protein [Candidatus Woesebacteria bacterium GW2011_GWA1_37_7]|uniref:Extracellular solute-binding protein n=1 Tax=Candidatus Woesebacteria bacterium GW2011_GWA1_37_7 TaxID=1618545 RepID=A0A0G0K9D5_9BACT|nr:MAG: extracellular solute-binding protein [Candidatus Woesebacteria bacterium GW2011_GWA1_37_7]
MDKNLQPKNQNRNSLPGNPLSPSSVLTQEADKLGALDMSPSDADAQDQGLSEDYLKNVKSKKNLIKIVFVIFIAILVIIAGLVVALNYKDSITDLFGTKGELEWWGLQDDEAVYSPLIDEYQKKYPNVKIRYIKQSPKDYQQRLKNSLLANNGPDIFEIHNSWIPMYKDLLSIMPNSIMSKEDFTKTFYPVYTNDLITDKGISAIPLTYDALTLYINEDVFAISAKQPPKTWDEFRTLAFELTQKDSQERILQSGASMGITQNVDHWPEIIALMLFQNGADPANPIGEKVASAIKFYISFAKESRVWDETLAPSTIAFANGKVAMYIAPSAKASEIVRFNPNLKFRTIPIPQLAKNEPLIPDVTYATYWVQGVWAKSTNQEVAWDFLKYLSEKDSLVLMNNIRRDVNTFEAASPRIDMANLYTKHLILSSLITMAMNSKSWYLADNTNDGDDGINSRIETIYKTIVDDEAFSEGALKEISPQISDVLRSFGVSTN